MIKTENLCKSFGDIKAANNVSLTITDNSIFGLAGANGAGKSTLLRMLSGVLKQDSGKIAVDGSEVYENLQKKSDIFFLPDTAYFFQNSTMLDMAKYFAISYPDMTLADWKSWQTIWDWKRNGKSVPFPRV